MVPGAPGGDGPSVQRPVAVVPRQGAESALIQHIKMGPVHVQGPLFSHNLVTLHHAKVVKLAVLISYSGSVYLSVCLSDGLSDCLPVCLFDALMFSPVTKRLKMSDIGHFHLQNISGNSVASLVMVS